MLSALPCSIPTSFYFFWNHPFKSFWILCRR